jgi:hypothetical protein
VNYAALVFSVSVRPQPREARSGQPESFGLLDMSRGFLPFLQWLLFEA